MAVEVKLASAWKNLLAVEFEKPYFSQLTKFVRQEYLTKKVFPPAKQIFQALEQTLPEAVKVVIIGQDPYHGQGQANGLAFSVNTGMSLPPSLQNIFKEIAADLQKPLPRDGNLERWTKQGVLLLNATLTVVANSPASHQHQGWEEFTDVIIKQLSQKREHLVFLLWGAYAQKKQILIDHEKHLILTAAHPSPFSADRGFFGCRHFSKANAYLKSWGLQEIEW